MKSDTDHNYIFVVFKDKLVTISQMFYCYKKCSHKADTKQ